MEAGSAAPRVDRPVYPRRVDHNTVTEGGIDKLAEACASGPVQRLVFDLPDPSMADGETRAAVAEIDAQACARRQPFETIVLPLAFVATLLRQPQRFLLAASYRGLCVGFLRYGGGLRHTQPISR